jgi:plastocyanin
MKRSVPHYIRYILITISLVLILSITNSCQKTSDVPGPNEVLIKGMAFNPSVITVTAGTTITWTNKDGMPHTATSTTGLFDSGSINTLGTYSHMFSTPGTYPYICTYHTTMTATVIVK